MTRQHLTATLCLLVLICGRANAGNRNRVSRYEAANYLRDNLIGSSLRDSLRADGPSKLRESDDLLVPHPFFSYLDFENSLVHKSLKQLQDSVAQVNSNLFSNPINKHLYGGLFNKRGDHKPSSPSKLSALNNLSGRNGLQLIQQLNKEIIKNQLIAYEKFFNKLRRYDAGAEPVESRQVMNLIRTLFRFPVLLLFSNIFQLPLLPTLILASPFLNNNQEGATSPNALANSLGQALFNSVSPSLAGAVHSAGGAASSGLQTAASNQVASHLPFSLNPLLPIDQLLNNFVSEIIGGLQNTPLFNSLMAGVNQMLVKPNRVTTLQSQALPVQSIHSNALNVTKKQTGEASLLSAALNATADELLSGNASTLSMSYQEPSQSAPLPNIPLIGPVPDPENPAGGSLLSTLASSLLETNKNHQLTGKIIFPIFFFASF